jgi:hypothetical protein
VGEQRDKLGSSGVFKAIVESARKFNRAVTGADEEELIPEAHELGNEIGRAFVSGRFADIHDIGTSILQSQPREQFVESWQTVVRYRGPFTGFEVANAGKIDLGFIPGLEEVPQSQFVAFLEIAFSSPEIPIEDKQAFTIGVVLLDESGQVRLGALHSR